MHAGTHLYTTHTHTGVRTYTGICTVVPERLVLTAVALEDPWDEMMYHHPLMAVKCLEQRPAKFFYKRTDSKYFRLSGLDDSCCNYLTLLW